MAPSTFWNFTFMDIVTALLTLLAIVVALWVALFTLKQNNRFHYETIKANFSLIIKIYGTSSYIC
ncbi:MAG: hypothetical protein FWF49_04930, partial [Oscillospiraceae bacterium]|nr:hypothetical protein [Oscillospiraceae bacterium]